MKLADITYKHLKEARKEILKLEGKQRKVLLGECLEYILRKARQ